MRSRDDLHLREHVAQVLGVLPLSTATLHVADLRYRERRALSVLQIGGHGAEERIRLDGVQVVVGVQVLPAAVRGIQGDLVAGITITLEGR
jgi:hypothetical protein